MCDKKKGKTSRVTCSVNKSRHERILKIINWHKFRICSFIKANVKRIHQSSFFFTIARIPLFPRSDSDCDKRDFPWTSSRTCVTIMNVLLPLLRQGDVSSLLDKLCLQSCDHHENRTNLLSSFLILIPLTS